MALDFDAAVVGIASQPFRLRWTDRHTLWHDSEQMQSVQLVLPTTGSRVQRHRRLNVGGYADDRRSSQLPHSCRQECADDRATPKPDAEGFTDPRFRQQLTD
jgi:hypothetical protein